MTNDIDGKIASQHSTMSVLDGTVVGIEEFVDNRKGRLIVHGFIKKKYVETAVISNDVADGVVPMTLQT